jgi:hypothetical protein
MANEDLGDGDPGDTDPGDTDPGDTDPGDTDPGDTDPGDTDPSDATDTDAGVAPAGSADPGIEGEDDIPVAPMWAMTTRMHANRRKEPGDEGRIRRRLGDDDDAIYVIDDGADHCMVGRRVGGSADGCVYCLVGRVSLEQFGDVVMGDVDRDELFADARDISLCGVFEEGEAAANVVLVQHYRRASDVPPEYLPPSPFIEFTEDPEDPEDES